ncbi:unnamed protein product [Mytilus edulis]|uniref:Uncharacterized protein n=1 Tax=Mytilus edulis TaxID=6550 RepID=A0A8S3SM92_MYTED|nr:unnamed protein product [Mytilus edulis]
MTSALNQVDTTSQQVPDLSISLPSQVSQDIMYKTNTFVIEVPEDTFSLEDFFIFLFTYYILCVSCLCVIDNTYLIDKDTENDDLVTYGFKKYKGLKICSHNVNRLECKFDEIKYNLMSTPNPPDIIGYCETFLGKNTSDREIDIPGYILQRKDRLTDGGGGWAVYLTETTSFSRKMILK